MKVLIIGLGSVALKHIHVIKEIDNSSQFFALRHDKNSTINEGITPIYTWDSIPSDINFIIISNPTHLHAQTILKASELNKPLFIEKPPVSNLVEWDEVQNILKNHNQITYCGFLLRFHPALEWLKANINKTDVLEFSAYCGSYLPDWRTDKDYTQSYSAKKNQGGGVHLDLIHEIDYIHWIFGAPISSNGYVKKISNLNIDSFDTAHYYLEYENTVGSISLNYYRRNPKRTLNLVLKNGELTVDLLKNSITDKNGKLMYSSKINSIELLKRQMNYFIDCVQNNQKCMNSFEDTYDCMQTCLNIKEL